MQSGEGGTARSRESEDPDRVVDAALAQELVDRAREQGDDPATSITGWADYTEYGAPSDPAATAAVAGTVGYGWLGAKQRSTTTETAGLTLMGDRLYNPTSGAFTSTDPEPGGNTTAYTYPQDPINGSDLDGHWGHWRKWAHSARSFTRKWGNRIGNLASHCAWIPGSIGIACSGISTISYLAAGNWKAAAVASIGLFTAGVGGGAMKIIRAGYRSRAVRAVAWAHINVPRSSFGYVTQSRVSRYRGRWNWRSRHRIVRHYTGLSTWWQG